ncbi:MAG: hypothetical protein KGY61_04500 [Desulfobacterales bacterium]|nr:hypothetical protein [Desulfobacterales bacterium]
MMLGYGQSTHMIKYLDPDEGDQMNAPVASTKPHARKSIKKTIITESGFFQALFKSRKP